MRLIDADKLRKEIHMSYSDDLGIREVIDEQPTVYDANKVVKSINETGQRYCNSVKCDKNCKDCEHGCLMRAIINAVKSGGVAND